MSDDRHLTPDELIRTAREAFDNAQDLTLAVEEEFAILDPETLALTNRFEELQAAAQGTELEAHLVGELIASEVEVRTGRCETFAEAAARIPERRAQLHRAGRHARRRPRRAPARTPGAPGRSSGSSTRRTTGGTTRSCATSSGGTTASASTSTSRSTAPTARSQVCDGAAAVPARPARALGELALRRGRRHGPALGAHRRSSRACSRAAAFPTPTATGPTFEDYVRSLYRTGSIDEHTQMWWSVRPHLAFPTVEIRICDAQPDMGEAIGAGGARVRAHGADRARDRRGRAAARATPHRLIEENFWRAIRYGLSGELIDLRTARACGRRGRRSRS